MAATFAAATMPWTSGQRDLPVLREEEDACEVGDGIERDRGREQPERVARLREVGPVDEGHERLGRPAPRSPPSGSVAASASFRPRSKTSPEEGLLSGRSRESTG